MRTMRATEVSSAGTVLPIAWNMLELTKIAPEATKFNAATWRYSSPAATTAGSFEKMRMNQAAASHVIVDSTSITPVASAAADVERGPDAIGLARAEVLARHRPDGESQRHHREEARLQDRAGRCRIPLGPRRRTAG